MAQSLENYELVETIDTSRAPTIVYIIVIGLAAFGFPALGSFLTWLRPTAPGIINWSNPRGTVLSVGLTLLFFVFTLAVHELLHATALWNLRQDAKLGFHFGLPFGPTITINTNNAILTAGEWRFVAVAPQVLTAMFIAAGIMYLPLTHLFIPLAGSNLLGGAIDFITVMHVTRYPAGYLFQDTKAGIAVYRPK